MGTWGGITIDKNRDPRFALSSLVSFLRRTYYEFPMAHADDNTLTHPCIR